MTEKTNNNESNNSVLQPPETLNTPVEQSEEEKKRLAEEEAKKKEEERSANLRAEADRHLDAIGIETHEMNFEEFTKDLWSADSSRVDFVLSAVPNNLEDETIPGKLASFCKSVLKSGCYIFLILDESDFHKFKESFDQPGFKVCTHGFKIL